MNDSKIREAIVHVLSGGQAHMHLDEAVEDFPLASINTLFPHGKYSSWHLLEHMRRTQNDILDFMINPNYKELSWPKAEETATRSRWLKTMRAFHTDLKQIEEMVVDRTLDITKKIPHGDGQTYIREFLLVADHTAYHLGEFAIMRQVMQTWKA